MTLQCRPWKDPSGHGMDNISRLVDCPSVVTLDLDFSTTSKSSWRRPNCYASRFLSCDNSTDVRDYCGIRISNRKAEICWISFIQSETFGLAHCLYFDWFVEPTLYPPNPSSISRAQWRQSSNWVCFQLLTSGLFHAHFGVIVTWYPGEWSRQPSSWRRLYLSIPPL
jgi:hypothetical protein